MTCRENEKAAIRELTLNEKIPIKIIKFLQSKFENLILAWSGGSDSTLLLLLLAKNDLLDSLTKIVFNNTRMNSAKTINYIDSIVSKLNFKDKFVITKPAVSRKYLEKIILEDYQKNLGKKHDKSMYRCCLIAKERPVIDYFKETGFENEQTVVLRGIRANESSQRFMSTIKLIESGQFYFNHPRFSRKIFVSNPLMLMPNKSKKVLLGKLCAKYDLELPLKSGCSLCPIYYKYTTGEEQGSDRYQKAQLFFGQKSLKKFLGVESET